MNNEQPPYNPFGQGEPVQPVQPPQPLEPAPQPQPNNNFIVQPPEPKPGKGLLLVSVILGALLVIALIVIAYFAFFQPKNVAPATDNETKTTTTEDKAATLTKKVKDALTKQLKDTYKDMVITDGTSAPMYKAPDTAYAAYSSDIGKSILIDTRLATFDQPAVTAVEQIANQILSNEADLHASKTDWLRTYQNENVICTVSTGSSPIFVSCANTADYGELIKEIAPFAGAYLASEDGKKNAEGIAFATPRITKKTNGFGAASLATGNLNSATGGAATLFYGKDSNWLYWRSTQAVIACGDYNTYELQRSFEGTLCIGNEGVRTSVAVTIKEPEEKK